jgi:hypothetical protein
MLNSIRIGKNRFSAIRKGLGKNEKNNKNVIEIKIEIFGLNFIKIARKGSDAIKKDLNKSKKVKIR